MMTPIGIHFEDYGYGPGKVIANLKRGLDLLKIPYKENELCDINGCLNWRIQRLNLPSKTLIGPNIHAPWDHAEQFIRHKNALVCTEWVARQFRTSPICAETNFQVWKSGIDTDLFCDRKIVQQDCFIYRKNRTDEELAQLEKILVRLGFSYSIINYGSYTEEQLLEACNKSEFCVLLDGIEMQSIAIWEIMATNTPVFIFEPEGNELRQKYEASSCELLVPSCGARSESLNSVAPLEDFVNNLGKFKPRQYIEENHTLISSAKDYIEMLERSHGCQQRKITMLQNDPNEIAKDCVVLVQSCKKFANRRELCRNSWVPHVKEKGIPVYFTEGGHDTTEIVGDMIHLQCDDGYRYMAEKLQALFRVMLQRNDWKYLIKLDDDVVFSVDRMIQCIRSMQSQHGDCCLQLWDGYHMTGGFMILTRPVVEFIANHQITNNWTNKGNRWTGLLDHVPEELRETTIPDDLYFSEELQKANKFSITRMPFSATFRCEYNENNLSRYVAIHDIRIAEEYRTFDMLLNPKKLKPSEAPICNEHEVDILEIGPADFDIASEKSDLRCILIEANPDHAEWLSINKKPNWVVVNAAAVGKEDEETVPFFFVPPSVCGIGYGPGGQGRIRKPNPTFIDGWWSKYNKNLISVEVPAYTFKKIVERFNIQKLNYLKISAQGADCEIITGYCRYIMEYPEMKVQRIVWQYEPALCSKEEHERTCLLLSQKGYVVGKMRDDLWEAFI